MQIHIDLSEEEKAGAVDTFYTVVKEELDIIPPQVRILEYLQEKAVFADGGHRQIKTATLPQHPIPKSLASVGLLAFVIVSKYMDGLPLYRQEGILKRYGGDVTRTTLANWMIRLSLQLQPGDKPMVLQGERGLSRKSATPGNASFYYSFTRLPTRGEIRVGDKFYTVEGNSWMDREWSSSALDKDQAGWDWFALQLDDGREVMYYQMRNKQGGAHAFSSGKLVEKDGRVHTLLPNQVMLMPSRYWQARDGERYPVKWSMQIAEHQLDLEVEAMFDDQLMDHTVRYWEGAVGVSGSHTGKGYLELSGYDSRE